MKLLALVAAGAAALAVLAAPAGATNECRGFQICVPIPGPWVVVPTSPVAFERPDVKWQLTCPKGFLVGGLDAELTDRSIDVTFEALLGSPVNPGISTRNTALFTGRAVAGPARAASFRPHIGCIPASGGGSRIPTVAHIVPPGHPSTRHVWEVTVHPGAWMLRKSCSGGETLVSATHAVGFDTKKPPSTARIASVHATQVVRNGRVTISIHAGAAVRKAHAVVQVILTCAGGT